MRTTRPPETVDDGHYLLIDGRRWRASDPSIPGALRHELVDELMAARRTVGSAGREGDHAAVAAARRRVDDAKRALGERGRAWWEEPTPRSTDRRIRATILTLARHRAPRTTCPSDAARAVGGTRWRGLMNEVRRVAAELHDDGEIVVLQRGEVVDMRRARGAVRLRMAAADG